MRSRKELADEIVDCIFDCDLGREEARKYVLQMGVTPKQERDLEAMAALRENLAAVPDHVSDAFMFVGGEDPAKTIIEDRDRQRAALLTKGNKGDGNG